MSIDRETGTIIAALMHALRPDWDTPGCLAAVAKVNQRHPADVAMAAVRLCQTPEAKTPGALANRDGQHWREKVAATVHRFPPRADQACTKHPGEWPDSCRSCAADRLAGDTSDAGNKRRGTPERMGEIRHLLDVARSTLCACGVEPEHCAEHNEEAQAREAARLAATVEPEESA